MVQGAEALEIFDVVDNIVGGAVGGRIIRSYSYDHPAAAMRTVRPLPAAGEPQWLVLRVRARRERGGRVARLLNVDRSYRYTRVRIGGEKRYLHQLVAGVWRVPGRMASRHCTGATTPENPHPSNIHWGPHNCADVVGNRRIKARGDQREAGKR